VPPPYVFDSSSFRVLSNYYPERFPSFWRRFNEVVADGRVLSVREVYNELQRQVSFQGWLGEWLRQHRELFVTPGSDEASFVSQIFQVVHFRTLVGQAQQLRGQPVADPFVIACARARAGWVVTEESMRPNAARIPNVCEHFGIDCTNVEGFMTQNGWEF
jgi:Domain of unknown function (DUF4411)